MILGFKPQFIDKILNGSKIHTIREDKHNRWKVGNKIHFATGVRTKEYNQFYKGVCLKIQTISFRSPAIEYTDGSIWESKNVYVNGFWVTNYKVKEALAKNDGFDSINEFMKWFPNGFIGKIIYWKLLDI